ncbi:aldehyde dehydrogenase family protein [Nocardia nova]|uniref:aldehyde dehydrogenase family protein n=1 Tax=Nocardia nova TaxID=37330 RepID=UPI000CEA3584|nr:aldehyde dehydrogenase family protein [Nocardia nova]PPJ12121.1 aldehyde dehydrogenase [Nocardia nova]PPJ14849.1 aldehyde dehydrogenase [Nocardia nova]
MSTTAATAGALDVDVPALDKVFIAGEWVDPAGTGTIDVVMPSTEEVVATVPAPGAADADAAVVAARAAFDEGPWPRMSPEQRAKICRAFADELETRLDALNRAWMFESGYTRAHGEMINSGAGRAIWGHAIEIAPGLAWEQTRTNATSEVLVQHRPIGTVLAILTYNGPVPLMGMKVIPALLAGCTVVVKFAPESQLTSRLIMDAAAAAGFPAGVISGLAAELETSKYLVAHPGIDMVHMTGGTAVAKEVVKQTSERLARTGLELGGKSPAIIADDVDIDEVLATLVPGAIGGCGQVCVALSRILVSRKRYDEVVDKLAEAFTAIKVGDPFAPDTDLGPLANKRALERTERMLARALEQGAVVAAGGKRPDGITRGYYFEPTLLRDVTSDMEIAQQEVFGPIIVVIAYDDIDDAIRIANDTDFGLAASVYARDRDAALEIALRIRSGGVALNLAGCSLTEPFGGVKQSGWGRECGAEGILEFTEIKQILLSGAYSG